jgi:hypothetical protein
MRCSFCKRHDSQVAKLAAGPRRIFARRVYICDRCAAHTIQIMQAHTGDDQPCREAGSFFRRMLTGAGWSRRHESECHAT